MASNFHIKQKPSSNLIMTGSVRVRVIRTLVAIQNGQSAAGVLDPLLNSLHEGDKGFAHALLLTTLRQWYALSRLLDSLADNPIDEIEVRTTIQVGFAQLLYLEVADHAAIHETVESVKELGFAHASGLVNAILRKVVKNTPKFRKKCDKKHSLPNWLAYQLKQDWSEHYDALTQGLRQPAPMFLRVNDTQTSVLEYQQTLADADISADLLMLTSGVALASPSDDTLTVQALRLHQTTAVSGLPDFMSGAVSVQDAHAQLAAPLIHHALQQKSAADAAAGNTETLQLLDACAAPGGKLAHWLEQLTTDVSLFHVKQEDVADHPNAKPCAAITAIDSDAGRIERIFDNLERLQLTPDTLDGQTIKSMNVLCADATTWHANKTQPQVFDAILLDAPCTATGVIRRHPDITLLRDEDDIEQTVLLQSQILDNLWAQLKVGGYLLYVTCSILKQENVGQMQDFIQRHADACAIDFTEACTWGITQAVGRQCLPLDALGGDGFYYALLQKTSA